MTLNNPRANETVLSIEGLSVAFKKGGRSIRALREVNLNLKRGEILGLVGESGCGKSLTALSAMMLLPENAFIESGEIKVNNTALSRMPEKQLRKIRGNNISIIFQEPMTSLNPLISIGRQIQESLELHRCVPRKEMRSRVIELLTLVEIPDPEARYRQFPFEFSGGMQQRVMSALALACNPQVLIADEPTTALDVTIQAQILKLLRNIRDVYGTAILLITHNMGVIADTADRVAVMYAGKVVETALVEDIFAQPFHPYTDGLLSSIPTMMGDRDQELVSIPGGVPDLENLPEGCSFQSRCPRVSDACKRDTPPLLERSPGRQAACWNPILVV
ncbi:MAG: ABC transporter ATP-binding protein [Synergistaceae bacterium]|jgi:oligopeptide/dipeptide ABC transporter ATP-binding protein|nr:ABC transporter ATP-binding protein [Synergistaceae bacterium]